jgi:hypothetical protein
VGGADAAAPPLGAYPEAGALRPLAERLLLPGAGDAPAADGGAPGPVEAASLLRVLAAAPRLPAAGWDAPARRLLLRPAARGAAPAAAAPAARLPASSLACTAGGGDPGAALRMAALEFVLAHAHAPALGLASVLDQALLPAAFAALPLPCRAAALRALPAAARALPASRAAPLLQGLPALLPPAPWGAGGTAGGAGAAAPALEAAALEAAAWEGLRGLVAALAARDGTIIAKVGARRLGAWCWSLRDLGPLRP